MPSMIRPTVVSGLICLVLALLLITISLSENEKILGVGRQLEFAASADMSCSLKSVFRQYSGLSSRLVTWWLL